MKHAREALDSGGEVEALRHEVAALRAELGRAVAHAQQVQAGVVDARQRQVALLAMVAHELRNPLMPLRLAAQMLDGARGDSAAHARLQATIQGQVAQMTRLIGDLLDGSRIATGGLRLERRQVELAGIVARAVETSQPGMEAQGHRFTCRAPAAPVRLLADPVRLVQVLVNLLENAARYTPAGRGEIALEATVHGAGLEIAVRDNGIGISAAALPRVFDLFTRDAHATAHHQDGLGIGLAVVRELVRAHEGSVRAASPGIGQGSEFVVTLPVLPKNAAAPA